MSAIGEILREIMPTWLTRPARQGSARTIGTPRKGLSRDFRRNPRSLAQQADADWQECIDEGLHCEAFPEPIAAARTASKADRKQAGQNRSPSKH
jgi:hypothetical protein